MRICHLAASHTTFSGRLFQREALSARRAGLDVTVIGVADAFPPDPPDHGCRIIPLSKSGRLGKLYTAWRLLWLGRRELCEIYHCHDPASLTAGAILKMLTRRGLIYDAHEDYPLTHSANITRNVLFRRLLRRALLIYEWWFVRFANEVLTVDPLIARKFWAMDAAAKVVPNFPRLREAVAPPVTLPDWSGRRAFVYVGGLNHRIAIREALEAVDRLRVRYPDILLVLVGKFEDDLYGQSIEQFLRNRALENHVLFVGQIPLTSVPQILTRCFAGLILYGPDDHYGDRNLYPVKLMEYMAAGLPIIASSFRGLSMVLRRWHCGLVANPASPEQIAGAMERLLSDAKLRASLAASSRSAFETRLHWEAVEPKLLAAYRRLASSAAALCSEPVVS